MMLEFLMRAIPDLEDWVVGFLAHVFLLLGVLVPFAAGIVSHWFYSEVRRANHEYVADLKLPKKARARLEREYREAVAFVDGAKAARGIEV